MNVEKLNLDQKRPCVILTNYGDDSLALIQWAFENELLKNHREAGMIKAVYIHTGFAADRFAHRITKGKTYVEALGFESIHLQSKITFQDAVLGRGEFPNFKFQWCSTTLKGLVLLDWLDEVDPSCKAIILSAKRREMLLSPYHNLEEWQSKAPHFNDRSLWHPLIAFNEAERDQLLKSAHFTPLGHRSLECDPCVNSCTQTIACLARKDIQKVKILEESLQQTLFSVEGNPKNIEEMVQYCQNTVTDLPSSSTASLNLFYRGCGNPFSCGL